VTAPLLEAALEYATRHSLPVLPLHSVQDGRCSCGKADCDSPGKHPRLRNGFNGASTDVAVVAEWWRRWPTANIGIRTGAVSGLVVLDVDDYRGGGAALKQLARTAPRTPEVLTGGGGRHFFFRHPGHEVGNSVDLGTGLDVRADDAYIVAPPSTHASGNPYRWIRPLDKIDLAPCPEWLVELNGARHARPASPVGDVIPEGERDTTLTSIAGTMRRRGMGVAEILAALKVTNTERCNPPLPERDLERIANSVGRYPAATPLAPTTPGRVYERTDLGNAEAFAAEHHGRLRHVKDQRRWLVWNEGRWRPDQTGEAERAAKETTRQLLVSAAEIDDRDERRAAVGFALKSQGDARIRALLSLASTEPEIVLAASALDTDPYLLACRNGTLDLRTGTLRPHDPDDLISLGTDVDYHAKAECPRFLRFLDEIFAGDDELVDYVHRAAGYTLTGDVREHVLFALWGAGRNGKTKLIEALQLVLGDFARTTPFDTFAKTRHDRGPRNDIARLRRARMVVAAESTEGRQLDEAVVKLVSGGDTIAARFLYGEFFEFRPEFKLWLVTNHRPRVDGSDDAIWARLRLIPFEVSFEGREDKTIGDQLAAEAEGILAWAVRGCLEWRRDGLGLPAKVAAATAEYRQDEDVLGAFLDERCTMDGSITAADFRSAFEDFCKSVGERPVPASVLGRRLRRRGVEGGRPRVRGCTGACRSSDA